MPKLTEAEVEARIKALREQQTAKYRSKWGEDPPPDASYQHFRDNHGNVVRHYRGTYAVCDYELKVGFAPTPEELNRHKKLKTALKKAESENKYLKDRLS